MIVEDDDLIDDVDMQESSEELVGQKATKSNITLEETKTPNSKKPVAEKKKQAPKEEDSKLGWIA